MPRTAHLLDVDIITDYADLDRPAIVRRSDSAPIGWTDLDTLDRAAIRDFALRQLGGKLENVRAAMDLWVKRGAVPPLTVVRVADKLEQNIEAVRRWRVG